MSFTGCWNYREIENLAIVSGIAVDKKEDKYIVTTEIIDIKGNKDPTQSTKIVSSEGITIFDAVRNAIEVEGRKLYFSHAQIVIINKDIAEESIIPVLDWITRDNEPRYTLRFLISKENSAKEILMYKPITSDILSFELGDMIVSERNLSKSVNIEEWQLLNDLPRKGISAVLPTVDITTMNNVPTPEISGLGIFKKDKLVGFLDGEETKTFLFINNKIRGGLLSKKEHSENKTTDVSLEILKNKTSLRPRYEDGRILIEIKTDTSVVIGENGGEIDYIQEPGRSILKKNFETMLENNIKNLVKKVQDKYDSDIFGFGKMIRIHMPGLWKKLEPQWDEQFKNVEIEVHSTINIENSAQNSKPIKVGD
jgi:spore germination protein KC